MAFQASIVVPLLKQKDDWLDQCIRSALTQTAETEVVVVVSAETPENNLEILTALRVEFENLIVMERLRPGFAAALNTGFLAATADRVGLLLSDDWLDPKTVEICLRHTADIVSTGPTIYQADGVTRRQPEQEPLSYSAFEACETVEAKARFLKHFFLFRRMAVIQAGGVDEEIGCVGPDDYDLIWTLLQGGASVGIVEQRLYCYRDHAGERLTNRPYEQKREDLIKILDKHDLHGNERDRLLEAQRRQHFEGLRRLSRSDVT